jgi:hypothetical protein
MKQGRKRISRCVWYLLRGNRYLQIQ